MEILYIIALLLLLFSTLTGKIKKISTIFSLIVLIILNFGVANQLDLYNYYNRYNEITIIDANREIGFYYIMKFFNFLNFDFAVFRCVMLILGLIFLILYIKRITKDTSFFMLVYMSYFAFMDIEQIRNFYAIILLVCAFKYLFYDDKISTIKYIVLVLISSTIHTSFILYLILLIPKCKINISKLMLRLLPIMVVVMFFLARYTNIQSDFLNAFSSEGDFRATIYSEARSKLGWIIPSIIYIWNIFILKYCYIINKGKNQIYEIKQYSINKMKIIKNIKKISAEYIMERLYWINIVGLIYLPLCINSLVFYRLNRSIIMINLLYITSVYNNQRDNRKKYLTILGMTVILIIGYFIFDFTIYNSWDNFYNAYFVERNTNIFL